MLDDDESVERENANAKGPFAKMRHSVESPLRAVLSSKTKNKAVCFRSTNLPCWPKDVQYTNTLDLSELSASEKRSLRLDYIPGVCIQR